MNEDRAVDPEVAAMQIVLDALNSLPPDDDGAVPRVLCWACRRFGVEVPRP